jgi:hypothetical protein
MTPRPFRHIGGAIIADHGQITLTQARGLAKAYAREAAHLAELGRLPWSRTCAARAEALNNAIIAACAWRRAAGWRDPDMAEV